MLRILIISLITSLALTFNANANVDFSGKSITWVIPFKEGGGTSRFARFIQPFLIKYLPGNPNIKIMHIPGGEQLKVLITSKKMLNLMALIYLDVLHQL